MVIILYSVLESISTNLDERKTSNDRSINEHLESLEASIEDLSRAIKLAKENFLSMKQSKFKNSEDEVVSQNMKKNNIETTSFKYKNTNNNQCNWRTSLPTNTTLNSRQLYDTLPFDNRIDTVWKQGYDIQYNISQWRSDSKLKVIYMPHSHVDPGWLHTFEQYFSHVVYFILNTIINLLNENKNYKFVWTEMSFLSLWWGQATSRQRKLFKHFLDNKQLEIVTGGWVMNDEATTHYYSMLDQLIEGHQFIENKFGNITIRSSWANDPFGYSPTMTYLLQRSGIQYMAIHRVHYHIKKALAKEKNLEFLWQQTWDRKISTRIFTHVLPFYAYDISHTCGPDPNICCQFDFVKNKRPYNTCPTGKNPMLINETNIEERATLLVDQHRKKAQLFRTNVLFVPLGNDFRYSTMEEAKLQFDNYDKLFKYINQRNDWNIQIQYGTLSDYFELIQQEKSLVEFPTYAGDFFTYADRADHYWSGYYTSRIFFKRMNRIAQSYLRTAEILFSMAHVEFVQGKISSYFPGDDLFAKLMISRRNLGIFQHHDAITGTSKDHVVNDYGEKLLQSIILSQIIIQQSASYLLFQNNYSSDKLFLLLNQEFHTFESLPSLRLISLFKRHIIYIYNPTDQRRTDIIKILLNTYQVRVTSNNQPIEKCQIDPKWSSKRSNTINKEQFELLILVDIEPYSLKEYTIHFTTSEKSCPRSTIEYVDEKQMLKTLSIPFKIELIDTKIIQINNSMLSIIFSKTGAILNVQHKNFNEKLHFHTDMIHYGTSKQMNHHSGAYVFIPDGQGQYIATSDYDFIRIQHGQLVSRVLINHKLYGLQYKLTNTNGSNDNLIHISTITHLTMNKDTEIALRLSTSIKNEEEFFTDLNDFQMIRRKTYEKLPLQGNVYPMSTMAYIEDNSTRLNILVGQPSGIACLKAGVVDIFLDRRLTQDDSRGLGQGILDNREIISTFKILFEKRHRIIDRMSLTGYPTLQVHHLSMELLYPVHVFHLLTSKIIFNEFNLFLKSSLFPGDYHLVNLRTLNNNNNNNDQYYPSKMIALILRRFAYDCDEYYDNLFHFEQLKMEYFFQIKSINRTSLSLRHVKYPLHSTSKLTVAFAEIGTYKIYLY